MIINNLKALIKEHNITPYALAKRAGVSPSNIKEIVDNETVVPRTKTLNGICFALKVNIDDILKYKPNRISAKSNKSMDRSRLTQNYLTNADYNIMDVMKRNEEREMMIY